MSVFFVQPSQRTLTPLQVHPGTRTAEPVSELARVRPVVAHAPDQMPLGSKSPGGWLSRWRKPTTPAPPLDESFGDTTQRVKDVMTPQVLLGSSNWTVQQARVFMQTHNIHHLPFINEEQALQGVTTLTGVLSAWIDTGPDTYLKQAPPPHPLLVTTPEATLTDLIISMLTYSIKGLPVVNHEGHLIGMVTESDLCRILLRDAINGWA